MLRFISSIEILFSSSTVSLLKTKWFPLLLMCLRPRESLESIRLTSCLVNQVSENQLILAIFGLRLIGEKILKTDQTSRSSNLMSIKIQAFKILAFGFTARFLDVGFPLSCWQRDASSTFLGPNDHFNEFRVWFASQCATFHQIARYYDEKDHWLPRNKS